jgi:hypothetical protein
VFNMGSLISVGTRLEKLMGTASFLLMCAQLAAAYSGILLAVATLAVLQPHVLG